MTSAPHPVERDVLALTRALTGLLPAPAVASMLTASSHSVGRGELTLGLRSGALHAFQQILARGGALALLRRGGWRRQTHYDARGGVSASRLWDASPAPLVFSSVSFEVVRWMTLEPLGSPGAACAPQLTPRGSGDELLIYLACALLSDVGLSLEPIGPLVAHTALAQLAFPDALVRLPPTVVDAPERVAELLHLPVLLGGLQADLVDQFLLRQSRRISALTDLNQIARIGRLMEARLNVLLAAAQTHDRLDLLRFVAEGCEEVLAFSAPRLGQSATLREQQQAAQEAAVLLRIAARVGGRYEALRRVGFVDDAYERAQALLTAWERYAPALVRARAALPTAGRDSRRVTP